jgi:hypothetical protein
VDPGWPFWDAASALPQLHLFSRGGGGHPNITYMTSKQRSSPKYSSLSKIVFSGAGAMAQRLRALTALPEVLSSIPSNHMVAHSHL